MRVETKVELFVIGMAIMVLMVPFTLGVASMLGVYQPVLDIVDQYLWLTPVIVLVYYCWLLWY